MDNLPKLHTYAKLMYDWGVQKLKKHFVHDLGARPQHGADQKDYEEDGGENDIVMHPQNFGDDEIWLGSLVGGQPNDLDFGLSEATEALDVGGRHLGCQGIQCGFHEDDEGNQP